jgi:hypothetical protein
MLHTNTIFKHISKALNNKNMTATQGRGRAAPRGHDTSRHHGMYRGRGTPRELSTPRGRGTSRGDGMSRSIGIPRGRGMSRGNLSGSRGEAQFPGVQTVTTFPLRGAGMNYGRGTLFGALRGRGRQQRQDLESPPKPLSPVLAPVLAPVLTPVLTPARRNVEEDTVSVSQPLTLQSPLRNEVEYVKSKPFGLEDTELNPLQDLGRVFDPYHGGNDVYKYSKFLTEKSPVVVSFVNSTTHSTVHDMARADTQKWTAYGSLYEHYNKNFISMVVHFDTQYPSIELLVKRTNGKTVSLRMFANTFKSSNKMPHLESYSGEGVRLDRLDLGRTTFSRDFYKRPNIGQIVMDLLPHGSSNHDTSLEDGRPRCTGDIVKQEMINIITSYQEASVAGTLSTFSKPDAVIARLSLDKHITISRALEGYDDHRCFDESMIHFKNCLRMCCSFGNLWFYTQLAGQYGQADDKRPWADAPRPYWLAVEWAIERNDSGEVIKAIPSKWSQFRHPGIFPDEQTAALARELNEINIIASVI